MKQLKEGTKVVSGELKNVAYYLCQSFGFVAPCQAHLYKKKSPLSVGSYLTLAIVNIELTKGDFTICFTQRPLISFLESCVP